MYDSMYLFVAYTNVTTTSTATHITDITTTTTVIVASTTTTAAITTYDTIIITKDIYSSITSVHTMTSLSSPTLSASQSDDNSSSVGVIVAIVVLVVVVFIIITVVVVGIIVVWKRKKSERHTKQEDVYYTTIDEATLQRSPTDKPISVYSEMNDGQDSKGPKYMDASKSFAKKEDEVSIQDNPAYSISSAQQVNMQDNPAYSEYQTETEDDPYYIQCQINKN